VTNGGTVLTGKTFHHLIHWRDFKLKVFFEGIIIGPRSDNWLIRRPFQPLIIENTQGNIFV